MPTKDFNEMCVFSTYNIASASTFYPSRPQKKSAKPSAFYTLKIRKSADPQIRILPEALKYRCLQGDMFGRATVALGIGPHSS